MVAVFDYLISPDHGWVKVNEVSLACAGLTEADISGYSFKQDRTFYLEEDCDAPKFLAAFRANYGPANLREVVLEHRPRMGQRLDAIRRA